MERAQRQDVGRPSERITICEVSRWLGHKSITTTVDPYGHLVPEASGRARGALDRVFAPAAMWPPKCPGHALTGAQPQVRSMRKEGEPACRPGSVTPFPRPAGIPP